MTDLLPGSPGTYALLLRLDAETALGVGRLGAFRLPAGWYLYVGSALGPGGLGARVRHHLAPARRPHWHIDFLRSNVPVVEVWWRVGPERLECAWAAALAAQPAAIMPVPGFGASDCRCPAHLYAFPARPTGAALLGAAETCVIKVPGYQQ